MISYCIIFNVVNDGKNYPHVAKTHLNNFFSSAVNIRKNKRRNKIINRILKILFCLEQKSDADHLCIGKKIYNTKRHHTELVVSEMLTKFEMLHAWHKCIIYCGLCVVYTRKGYIECQKSCMRTKEAKNDRCCVMKE